MTPRAILTGIGVVVLVVVIGAIIYAIAYPGGSSQDASTIEPSFPPGGPAEFLYLDATRIATYLAQVEGGEIESEKLTHKLTQNLNAKLEFKSLGEVGATKVSELFAEKNVKPTAASSFFVLRGQLEAAQVIHSIDAANFEAVSRRSEGDFIEFETEALVPPAYINAYLAVLHAGTLAAIFPKSPTRRKESTNFFKKVGSTPRAVFAIRPDSVKSETPAVYLLPFSTPLLSSERSLIKNGGGNFTVLGKVVRIFPEPPPRPQQASYVDSATREIWEQALKSAPDELLCRTEPMCAETVRGTHLSGKGRGEVIEEGRQQILEALDTQTMIPERGAVILPIAVYK